MTTKAEIRRLGSRTFDIDDQQAFADYSGDRNPIHLDPQVARKTVAGDCIAHGVHTLLWGIELLVKTNKTVFQSFAVTFFKPIFLGPRVHCCWNETAKKITIINDHDVLLASIVCRDEIAASGTTDEDHPIHFDELLREPKTLSIGDVEKGMRFDSKHGGLRDQGSKLFPCLETLLGQNTVYEIASLSNIVGMQTPGLLSLFYKCSLDLSRRNQPPAYKVAKADDRFNLLELDYTGRNLDAKLVSFFRPAPAGIDSCQVISERMPATDILAGRHALVIGGSRGLGAWVAKVLALNGADVTVTYAVGRDDALELCADIQASCQVRCDALALNVLEDLTSIQDQAFHHLYYFATPKIFGKQSKDFDAALYQNFHRFYCDAFEKIAEVFIANGGVKVFYPSSAAVDQNIKELEEYACAKLDGEKLCEDLARKHHAAFVTLRIDRVLTDQTLSIQPVKSLEPLDVARDIMGAML